MNLVVDIGNTNTKIGVFDQTKLLLIESYSTKNLKKTFLKKTKLKQYLIKKSFIGSVVPSKNQVVIQAIQDSFNLNPQIIQNKLFKKFFNLENYNLKEIGSDILAAALYLQRQDPHSAAIIFGTATVGLAIDSNKILGVSIASNFENGMNKIIRQSEMINEKMSDKFLKKENFILDLGHDTITALQSGYSHSLLGFILSYQTFLKKAYHISKIYVSGGNSNYLPRNFKDLIFDKEIVIKGYNFLTYNNY